jgi:hypothetical protein
MYIYFKKIFEFFEKSRGPDASGRFTCRTLIFLSTSVGPIEESYHLFLSARAQHIHSPATIPLSHYVET